MKNLKTSIVVAIGLAVVSFSLEAQNVFPINIKGTRQVLDSNGQIVTEKVSNQTFVQDAADAVNAGNPGGLTLVYNLGADPDGDLITVVNTNGTSVYTNLALKYTGDFGVNWGGSITNADQTQFARAEEVIPVPLQSTEELGHALVDGRLMMDKHGNIKKFLLTGSMIYFKTNNVGASQLYNLNFVNTGKPLPTP